ncbi:hypothetical protein PR002_g12458 [Phytophthora rubi]|uniref:Uncharacterized protein n=1 Tax=Phytophthora rubi TaxID=129364 RepID=A0A6A3LWN5_9STRA|nr:hypothetical protein PR002_g12458 [Phytophthora rubi]
MKPPSRGNIGLGSNLTLLLSPYCGAECHGGVTFDNFKGCIKIWAVAAQKNPPPPGLGVPAHNTKLLTAEVNYVDTYPVCVHDHLNTKYCFARREALKF